MSSRLDEYLSGEEYSGHKPGNDGFSRFEKGGEYYFAYYDKSGKVLLRSQGYKGEAGRDNGIESVKKNRKVDEHWSVKEDGGKWFLVLIAGNRQEIARGIPYNSKAEAEGARHGGSSGIAGKIAGAGAGAGIVSNLTDGKGQGKVIKETRGDAKEIERRVLKETKGEAKEVGRRELESKGEAKEISRGKAKEVGRGEAKEISRGKGKEVERRVVNETRREVKSTPVYKEKVAAPPPPKPKPAPVKKAAPVKKVAAAAPAAAASTGCFKWWMLLPLLFLIPFFMYLAGCFAAAPVVVPPPVVVAPPPPPPPPPPAPAVVPPPVIAAVCPNDCQGSRNPVFNLPGNNARARKLTYLGSNPEYGNVHSLSPKQFYEKLKRAYDSSASEKRFLDGIYKEMGYDKGFSEAAADQFSSVTIDRGQKGNIGYSKAHKTLYVQLNTSNKDLQAFRIKAANGCHLNFMKTCGNHFYFCPKVES